MEKSCLYKSPIGILKLTETDGKITSLYPYRKEDGFISYADAKINQQEPCNSEYSDGYSHEQKSALLKEACLQLDEYFLGKRKTFDLPIKYAGTLFQESVWRELQNIPYGETRSYEYIAVKVGHPKAVRAVGQANNRNKILLIVPCHRVIHKSGDISGFACGIETKKYLLNLEKSHSIN